MRHVWTPLRLGEVLEGHFCDRCGVVRRFRKKHPWLYDYQRPGSNEKTKRPGPCKTKAK